MACYVNVSEVHRRSGGRRIEWYARSIEQDIIPLQMASVVLSMLNYAHCPAVVSNDINVKSSDHYDHNLHRLHNVCSSRPESMIHGCTLPHFCARTTEMSSTLVLAPIHGVCELPKACGRTAQDVEKLVKELGFSVVLRANCPLGEHDHVAISLHSDSM